MLLLRLFALILTWSQGLHRDRSGEPLSLMSTEIFNRGPIACGIDATKILDYSSSIASGLSFSIDRVVSVVGWCNDASEGKYWIVRNSGGVLERAGVHPREGWLVQQSCFGTAVRGLCQGFLRPLVPADTSMIEQFGVFGFG